MGLHTVLVEEREGRRKLRPETRARYLRAIEAARQERDTLHSSVKAWVREQRSSGRLPKRLGVGQLRLLTEALRQAALAS